MTPALWTLVATLFLAPRVYAHPGADIQHEIEEQRRGLATMMKRDLSHCKQYLEDRGHHARQNTRRQDRAQYLRQKRGITKDFAKRDLETLLNTNHESNLTGVTAENGADIVFSDNSSCILYPDVTEGPYYVVGEQVRQDVTEGEVGVPLFVDVQILDVNSCEPVPDVALDYWTCNSTGVYSGISAEGNGDEEDLGNLQNQALRGIQISDTEGLLSFQSIFPGHYTGRATHVHVMAHLNNTIHANNTISGGYVAHVGQFYFDQDLISEVEGTAPYNENTQQLTLNQDDLFLGEVAPFDVDPFINYIQLGDSIEDGIYGWITIALHRANGIEIRPAVICTESGCEETEDGGPSILDPDGGDPSEHGPISTGTVEDDAPSESGSSDATPSNNASVNSINSLLSTFLGFTLFLAEYVL